MERVAGTDSNASKYEGVQWGPVADDDVVTINFPNSTDWVKVKRYITEEDDALANDEAMKEGMKILGREERRRLARKGSRSEMQMYFKSGAYRMFMLRRLIKDWSFVYPDGRKWPITPENIVRLPTHTRDFIMEQVDDLNPNMNEEDDEEESDEEEGSEAHATSSLLGPRIHPLD